MLPTTHSSNPITTERRDRFLSRQSVIEMRARERAQALLDPGSFRELLGPFDRMESPWLPLQGVVPESDDGVIIARGQLAGKPAVIMAIERAFQGGGMGEVSASKIAGALGLARADCEKGKPILPVLLLETGGVRLQEANLGEAVVAEIHAEIIALRQRVPVIGAMTGMVGCLVVYLQRADKSDGPVRSRQQGVNQAVIIPPNRLTGLGEVLFPRLWAHPARSTLRSSCVPVAYSACGCGHGSTRNNNTPAAMAGVQSRHFLAEPIPLVGSGCGSGWCKEV
jgi:hypothetical protein